MYDTVNKMFFEIRGGKFVLLPFFAWSLRAAWALPSWSSCCHRAAWWGVWFSGGCCILVPALQQKGMQNCPAALAVGAGRLVKLEWGRPPPRAACGCSLQFWPGASSGLPPLHPSPLGLCLCGPAPAARLEVRSAGRRLFGCGLLLFKGQTCLLQPGLGLCPLAGPERREQGQEQPEPRQGGTEAKEKQRRRRA